MTRSTDLSTIVEWQPGRGVSRIAWRLPLNQRTADPLYTPSTISLYIYLAPPGVLFVDSQTVVLLRATTSFLFSGNCHGFHGQLAWHYGPCLDIYLPASTLDRQLSFYTSTLPDSRCPDITGKINFTKYGKEEVFNINILLFKYGFNPIT